MPVSYTHLSARPDRLIMFRLMPVKYMSTMANSTLKGMLTATTRVGRRSLRNRASTTMARICLLYTSRCV